MSDPFVLDKTEYVRQVNPVVDYKKQAVYFLTKMTGKSERECWEFVNNRIRVGQLGIKDPVIRYLERQDNGDRIEKEGTILEYIGESISNNEIIAPTLTTYLSPAIKESLYVAYIESNIAVRNRAKKAQFAAEAIGDLDKKAEENISQTNEKLANNAISGGHVSPSTPLFNKTAHSSLTSNCRTTSGYGNANNEKFLSGNRHYWSPTIVVNNITSIISNTDYPALEKVILKYNIKYPSVEDVMECITYSTNLYWKSNRNIDRIRIYVERLTAIERASFFYTGDFYQLKQLNNDLVLNFLNKLALKSISPVEEPLKILKEIPEDYVSLAHQICSEEMLGKGKKYTELTPDVLNTLASTAKNIQNVINDYSDLIKSLYVTKNVPASVAHIPESIRRVALTSDTDSTIFTVQDWVYWSQGNYVSTTKSIAIAATMIFLASRAIVHILARMSANFGVEEKRIFQTAMKNEFFFPAFVPTNVAKHYFASISSQEGNIKQKLETEIKGVHLKSSNAPKEITKRAKEMIEEILESIRKGEKISLTKYLKEIANKQREIKHSLERGDTKYYRLGEIKLREAYKDPNKSQYVFHELWEKAFMPQYPCGLSLPYSTIKIATTLTSNVATREWLSRLENKEIASGISAWLADCGKVSLPTIQIPIEAVGVYGIPKELLEFVDSRRVISDLTQIFVLIMETLGAYFPKEILIYDLY